MQYAPCEGDEEAEDHYKDLVRTICSIPKHNLLLVMGDFNADIGSADALFTYHTDTNKNGQLLLDLAEETAMTITNTRFQKKKGKLWTYMSEMNNSRSQVDYILINNKWKNSVKDVSAFNSYSSVGSDQSVRARM